MTQEELLVSDKNLLHQHKEYTSLEGLHWIRLKGVWYYWNNTKYSVEDNVDHFVFRPTPEWYFRELTDNEFRQIILNQLLQ